MNLRNYDEALLEKLQRVFPNTISCNSEKAISESRNENNEVYLPLLSFWRISNNFDPSSSYHSDVYTRRGIVSKLDQVAYQATKSKSYVVDIYYQIDIWSDKREEVDLIYRELVMFILEEPTIEVTISDYAEEFNLLISETDTTPDMSEFTDKGKLYRNSITLHIPNARMVFEEVDMLIKEIQIRVFDMNTDKEL